MGIMDAFGKEDRVELTVTNLIGLIREAVKTEFLMNSVVCGVPHKYIVEMATGSKNITVEELEPDMLERFSEVVKNGNLSIIENFEDDCK